MKTKTSELGNGENSPLLSDCEIYRKRVQEAGSALCCRDELEKLIRERTRELQNEIRQRQALSLGVIKARESERKYIARELHDEIGQLATGLKLGLAALEQGKPPDRDTVLQLRALADELISEIRNLSLGLRPSLLDDFGLQAAIDWLCGRFLAQTGIDVTFNYSEPGRRRFKPEIETVVYRIVQESLTNVARYADVDTATVDFDYTGGSIHLQISDAGRGFDASCMKRPGECIGLFGMRERIESVGGSLTIESAPDAGTNVTVVIPLDDQKEDRTS